MHDFQICQIINARKRSYGKVMFYTCLSFCSQGGCLPLGLGGGCLPLGLGGVDTPLGRHPSGRHPPEQTPPAEMTIEAGSTHPTGMHFRFRKVLLIL